MKVNISGFDDHGFTLAGCVIEGEYDTLDTTIFESLKGVADIPEIPTISTYDLIYNEFTTPTDSSLICNETHFSFTNSTNRHVITHPLK